MPTTLSVAHTAISLQMASLQEVIHQNAKSFGTFGGEQAPSFGANVAMPTPATGVGTQLDLVG